MALRATEGDETRRTAPFSRGSLNRGDISAPTATAGKRWLFKGAVATARTRIEVLVRRLDGIAHIASKIERPREGSNGDVIGGALIASQWRRSTSAQCYRYSIAG
jgi:hypothetical protein